LRQLSCALAPTTAAPIVRLGRPADEILRFARDAGADAIVIGKHGAPPPGQIRGGTVMFRVLERARCPVITVPQRRSDSCLTTRDEWPIRGVLVGTDMTEGSRAALAFARAIGQRLGCAVHALHVVEASWARSPVYAPPPPDAIETLRRTAARHLSVLTSGSGRPADAAADVATIVHVGDPAHEIVQGAAECADDLIVLGTHGRRPLGRLLFGSVARDVVARATCPVVTVRGCRDRRARRPGEAPTSVMAGV
jgi:nucleotide-binding universal stress UspA family protein